MKKILLVGIVLSAFQPIKILAQDLVSGGANSWIFHTPDDGRTTLHIAPLVNGNWSWNTQTYFSSNGDVNFSGKTVHANNMKIFGSDEAWAEGLTIIKSAGWSGLHLTRNDPSGGNYSGNWALGYNASTGNDFSISTNYIGTQYDGLFHISNVTRNVGIGTITPDQKLSVNGNISLTSFGTLSSNRSPSNSYTNLFLGGGIVDQANGTYKVITDGGSNYFAGIKMDNWGGNVGAIKFYSGQTTGGNSYYISNAELENYARMTIVNGNVGIGTTDPKGYKLAVAGKAIAEEVTVKLQANWPDYVFEPTYNLSPLDSIKTYIDKNKHLPEVPSAKEMEKNGVNLGEMNMLLLKKIEELTLYVIELKKRDEVQQIRIDNQEKEIQNLKVK